MTAATWHRVPPPLGDDEPNEFVEYWQPRVGDRVRVRLSGECDGPPFLEGSESAQMGHRHDSREDGRTGTVVSLESYPTSTPETVKFAHAIGHIYAVVWDERIAGLASAGNVYPAAELEPLSDSEPAADERRRAAG